MRVIISKLCPILFLGMFSIAQGVSARPVHAAPAGNTFTVNSEVDLPDGNVNDDICLALNGKCTLRAGIMQANFIPGPDTIKLPAGTYKLTLPGVDDNDQIGDLDISGDLAIEGAGSGQTIVDGNGAVTGDRVFHTLSTAGQTTLSGMTIRNGVSVYNSLIQDAGFGGGIYQDGGDLSLSDMIIEDNQASYGGGLAPSFFNQQGTTNLERVTIRSNQAKEYGGGVYLIDMNSSGTSRLSVSHSAISGNMAKHGGGISFQGFGFNGVYQTIMALTNTTVSGNSVDHDGGGIYNLGGLVQLANVTIANNQVNLPAIDNGGLGGGGVTTVSANGFTPTVDVKNSLIGNNIRRKEGSVFSFQDDCNGALTSFGHNLFQSTTNCTINDVPTDLKNVDPRLGSLQYNGGPTQTQALLIDSPAIDQGNPNGCIDFNTTIVTTDQRGVTRPQGAACDIGAVEMTAADFWLKVFLPIIRH